MKIGYLFTRKSVIIGSSALVIALVVAGFFVSRRPPRVSMERYAPADSLALVEINSLTDLVDGMTHSNAWRELAPVLGLSSQLKQVGLVADLIGRTGLGPDEAVVAGRAQCAIAITGIESKTGETEDGAYIHLKPHFALIIETHTKPETAARLVRERAPIIAQRIYGDFVAEDSEDYRGAHMLVFSAPEPGHQLVAAYLNSIVLIANHEDAMKSCLDSIAGRAATLAEAAALKELRPVVDNDAAVFAYVTERGIVRLAELWPALIAGRAADPESVGLIADLIEHISEQAGAGLLYSAAFEAGGVTEKYLTALRPPVAEALTQPLKSASAAGFESLRLIPREIESVTLLNVEGAGDLPERILKQLSPNLDLVAGVALREFVISFRKQYGLEPSDSVAGAVGNEIALVNFGDDQPRAMLIRVIDKPRLGSAVANYVSHKSASVAAEQYNGTEVLVSSEDVRRAAAFAGDFLILGTRDQIIKIIANQAGGGSMGGDERLRQALGSRPAGASIIYYRPRVEDAGRLLLAISKLTRVTDGSRALLERDSTRAALQRLPPVISFTEMRSYGIYTESRSPVGNFSLLAPLIGTGDAEE